MPERPLQTRRGNAVGVSYQHFSRSGGMAVQHPSAANLLTFNLASELVTIADERGLPVVSEGDEVEVSGAIQGRARGFGATSLTNHTTGQTWQFSKLRAVGRGASAGCMGSALSLLGMLLMLLLLLAALPIL
ncbi:MAG: hypothetical protein Q7O66_06625 [Dehalococcoidia bacterium]|nr:hypothetical protein [Dehalococcoidia bacterium]